MHLKKVYFKRSGDARKTDQTVLSKV